MSAVTLFLALLLAVSAGHKLVERTRFAPIAAHLAGAASSFGPVLLVAAIAVEAVAALALLVAPVPIGGVMAAMLWGGYALALWRRQGERIDCGCDFTRRERPIGGAAIARPALLAALAIFTVAAPRMTWTPEAPFAALALLLLWFAASELSAIPEPAREKS